MANNKKVLVINSIIYNETEVQMSQLFISYILNIVPDAETLNCEAKEMITLNQYFDFDRYFSTFVLDNIKKHSDLVFCCSISSISRVLKIIPKIKKYYPNKKIYIIGPNIKELSCFIEFAFSDLLYSLYELTILFNENNIININLCEKNLNDFILDNLNIKNWNAFKYNKDCKIPMVASKGCKYRCSFCDYRKCFDECYKAIDINNINTYINQNIKNFQQVQLSFLDGSLTTHPNILQLCSLLEKYVDNLKWNCFGRVNEITNDISIAMKNAGCVDVILGIESGYLEGLKNCNKSFVTKEKTIESVEILRKNGMHVSGSFILGIPGENESQAIKTIEFAKTLNLNKNYWHIYFPTLKLISNLNFNHPYRKLVNKQFVYSTDIPNQFWENLITIDKVFLYHRHAATNIPYQFTSSLDIFPYPILKYINLATNMQTINIE